MFLCENFAYFKSIFLFSELVPFIALTSTSEWVHLESYCGIYCIVFCVVDVFMFRTGGKRKRK